MVKLLETGRVKEGTVCEFVELGGIAITRAPGSLLGVEVLVPP